MTKNLRISVNLHYEFRLDLKLILNSCWVNLKY